MTTTNPLRVSPVQHVQAALGGVPVRIGDWEVMGHFQSPDSEARNVHERVGLADVSWLGKVDFKGDALRNAGEDLRARLLKYGIDEIWELGRGHWLGTFLRAGHDSDLIEKIQENEAGSCFHVTDMSSVYAALLLAGPNSRDVLNRLTELDVLNEAFPNLSARETGLAHVHAFLLRDDLDEAIPAFQLLFARSFGEHVWNAVMEAGEQFGILPFGLNAMNIINQ